MLTKKLINLRTKSLLKKNPTHRSSMIYDKADQIGVIFTIDSKEKHDTIKSFIKQLEADGKKVDVIAYLPKNKENYEFLFDFYTAKDISFWGSFTSDKVTSFASKSFDYLFYIDTQSNILNRNILAMSKAKCRVAPFDELNEDYSEMMVQVPKKASITELVNEMYRYTKLLS